MKDIGKIFRGCTAAALLAAVAVTGCSKDDTPGAGSGTEVLVRLPGVSLAAPVEVTPGGRQAPQGALTRSAAQIGTAGTGTASGDTFAADAPQDLFSVMLGAPAADTAGQQLSGGETAEGSGADAAGGQASGADGGALPDTRAEVALSNVWVFQFDASGKAVRCEKKETLAAGRPLEVRLTSGDGYTIGVVAGGPADGLSTSNVPDLETFRTGLLFTGSLTSDDAIPYAGTLGDVRVLDNGQVQVGGSAANVPVITLKRILARVTVLLTHKVTDYALDGIELYSVPVGAPFAADPAAAAFPAGEDGNFAYRSNTAAGLAPHAQSGGSYTWYVGPNRRGTGTGISKVQDKNASKAPAYATYARVKTHSTTVEDAPLYYDIYLGEDMFSDFNVTANHVYSYTTRIVGSAQAHYSLIDTDGRVSGKKPLYVESATVTPSGNIPGQGGTYAVTLNGLLPEGGVEVRAIVSGATEALVSGKATQSGTAVELAIPANDKATERTVVFEYEWDKTWTKIEERTQAAGGVQSAAISPDPSGGFSADATTFTVTLTGNLGSGISVQARISGQTTALVSATATVSGTGVTLTVPTNSYPNAARTIVFGYVEGGEFKEIKRGTQAKGENINTGGGGTVIEPDPGQKMTWQNAINYCSSKGDGWRLPTQNELMYYWCVEPSIPADSKFAAGIYWSATEHGSSSNAWDVRFSDGYTNYDFKTNSSFVRCVRDK